MRPSGSPVTLVAPTAPVTVMASAPSEAESRNTSSAAPSVPSREPERGQVGARDVEGRQRVAAADRRGVDPLDVVEVHRDVPDVAGEADAGATVE